MQSCVSLMSSLCPVIRRRVVSPCVRVSSRFLEHSVDDRAQALTLPHGSSEPLDPSLFFPLQPYHHAVTLQWQQPERLEPWLSSCRAVEAPSRHCRGARRVEQLQVFVSVPPRPCDSGPRAWGSCGLCRVSCERSQRRRNPLPGHCPGTRALDIPSHHRSERAQASG